MDGPLSHLPISLSLKILLTLHRFKVIISNKQLWISNMKCQLKLKRHVYNK